MSNSYNKYLPYNFWILLCRFISAIVHVFTRSTTGYPARGGRPYYKNDQRIIIDPGKDNRGPKSK